MQLLDDFGWGLFLCGFGVGLVLHNIPWLALQRLADGGKGGKSDGRYLVVFDF